MKKRICLLFCMIALFGLFGCENEPASLPAEGPPAETAGITFTDDLGREITVSKPQRTAALIGSFADIWCLAGGADSLVAAANDAWTQFSLELGEDQVANLGSTREINVETLLAADPDFVIGSTKTEANVELMEILNQAKIPVAYFDVSSFDDYLRMLKICTQLTGCEENYSAYGLDVQKQIQTSVDRVSGEAPTVLYIRSTGSSVKVKNSENTVLGEMLADLGCVNIADSETSLLENLSIETIIASDPTYIFVVLQGTDTTDAQRNLEMTLLSNPAWNGLTAVQEGRYYIMDQRLYNVKPNARWGEAYEKLADILYPEK